VLEAAAGLAAAVLAVGVLVAAAGWVELAVLEQAAVASTIATMNTGIVDVRTVASSWASNWATKDRARPGLLIAKPHDRCASHGFNMRLGGARPYGARRSGTLTVK
jgi:hypothetical protein